METAYLDEKFLISRRSAREFFRSEIFEEWNYSCAYCGSHADTLDHIHPKSKGGPREKNNLVACCSKCNLSKSNKFLSDWYPAQSFYCYKRQLKLLAWSSGQCLERFIKKAV